MTFSIFEINVVRLNLVYFTNYNFYSRKGAMKVLQVWRLCDFATLREYSKKTSKINSSNYKALNVNLLTRK